MDSIYEVLMDLPLFKGVSYNKISEIVEKVRFHFLRFGDGEPVVRAGEACTHLKCIISGKARLTVESADGRLRVSQTLEAPDVIAPDFLFGRNTLYPCTAVACGGVCGIMQIAKADYVSILFNDEVFMFNFLNMLSKDAQKSLEGVLALTGGSLEERIAFWVVALTQPGAVDVVMECRHRDLYSLFGVPRAVFFQTLQSMRERGLVDFAPNRISVASRRSLLELLQRRLIASKTE